MALDFVDACEFLGTAGGLTDFVAASARPGFQMPAVAGAVDGATYRYRAESNDLNQWEIGNGTWSAATSTLARTTVIASSNAGAKVNFTNPPYVGVIALATDYKNMVRYDAQTPSTGQQGQARSNIAISAVNTPWTRSGASPNPATSVDDILQSIEVRPEDYFQSVDADDTNSFSAAVAAIKAAGGGRIKLSRRDYTISSGIFIDFKKFQLVGQGAKSRITYTGSGICFSVFNNTDEIRFSDFRFEGALGATSGILIQFSSCDSLIRVENIWFENGYKHIQNTSATISTGGAYGIWIDHCHFVGATSICVESNPQSADNHGLAQAIWIQNCGFTGFSQYAFYHHGGGGVYFLNNRVERHIAATTAMLHVDYSPHFAICDSYFEQDADVPCIESGMSAEPLSGVTGTLHRNLFSVNNTNGTHTNPAILLSRNDTDYWSICDNFVSAGGSVPSLFNTAGSKVYARRNRIDAVAATWAFASTASPDDFDAANDDASRSVLTGGGAANGLYQVSGRNAKIGITPRGTDNASFLAALQAAAAQNTDLILEAKTYTIIPGIVIGQGGYTPPRRIVGVPGTVIQAQSVSGAPLVTISNPHGFFNGFDLSDICFDANGAAANAFMIFGSQHAQYRNIEAKGATGDGILFHGTIDFGIYYNVMSQIYSHDNGGRGFHIYSDAGDGQYYFADNATLGFRSHNNASHQYDFDYASGSFLDLGAESSTAGSSSLINIDHSIDLLFLGCYLENYHIAPQGYTGTANSTNVRIIGGRNAVYDVSFIPIAFDINLISSSTGYVDTSDANGGRIVGHGCFRGIGINGAGPLADAINSSNGLAIARSGSTLAQFFNGLRVGSVGALTDMGTGTVNVDGGYYVRGASQYASAYLATNQGPLTANTSTKVNLSDNMRSGPTFDATNHRIIIAVAGKYRVSAQAYFTGGFAAGDRLSCAIEKNGSQFLYSQVTSGGTRDYCANITGIISCAASDYIELFVDSSGTPTLLASSLYTHLDLEFLGP